jgi:transcriptional regulator with XRE-family HTH domain
MRKAPTVVRGKPDPTLGVVIRQAREDAGLSQAQLAVHADLAVGTLTRLEAGTSDPSWSSVRSIAEALGLSMEKLGRLVEAETT